MKKIVDADSCTMGVFHSDKKLSAPVKQSVQQHSQNVNSFVSQNGGDATKSSKVTSAAKSAGEKVKSGLTARALPNVSESLTKAVEQGLGLGE